jgi:nucleoside-diphosphate-sugar epimerase
VARILIAGCGYLGTALGERLAAAGHTVWGLRRSAGEPPGGGRLPGGIAPLSADLCDPASLSDLPPELDFVFFTAAPNYSSDAVDREAAYRATYLGGPRNLLAALADQNQNPRGLFFTSSTSVYGQRAGEWVDETSPAAPEHFAGKIILEAEGIMLGAPWPATAVRLGGLYGPGRARLIESVRRGDAALPEGPPRYVNRIHRDDAAGILHHLMDTQNPEAIYISADGEPAGQGEVLGWLAEKLGVASPRGVPPPQAGGGAGDTGRLTRTNKRCSSARIRAAGYSFLYPSFREGYGAMLSGEAETS